MCKVPWTSHQTVAGKVGTGKKSAVVLFGGRKVGLLVCALKWGEWCGREGGRHCRAKWSIEGIVGRCL